MNEEHWNHDLAKSMGVFLSGHGLHYPGPKGEAILDDNFYLIFNANQDPLEFQLPPEKYGSDWITVIDTNRDNVEDAETYQPESKIQVPGRTILVLHNKLKHEK